MLNYDIFSNPQNISQEQVIRQAPLVIAKSLTGMNIALLLLQILVQRVSSQILKSFLFVRFKFFLLTNISNKNPHRATSAGGQGAGDCLRVIVEGSWATFRCDFVAGEGQEESRGNVSGFKRCPGGRFNRTRTRVLHAFLTFFTIFGDADGQWMKCIGHFDRLSDRMNGSTTRKGMCLGWPLRHKDDIPIL